jgi:hypothetical protein
LFVPSFFRSFIHSFIHSFVHSFIHSFVCSFIHSFIYLFIYLLIANALVHFAVYRRQQGALCFRWPIVHIAAYRCQQGAIQMLHSIRHSLQMSAQSSLRQMVQSVIWYASKHYIIEAHKDRAPFSAPIFTTVTSSQECDVYSSYTELRKNRRINVESVNRNSCRPISKARLYSTDFQET